MGQKNCHSLPLKHHKGLHSLDCFSSFSSPRRKLSSKMGRLLYFKGEWHPANSILKSLSTDLPQHHWNALSSSQCIFLTVGDFAGKANSHGDRDSGSKQPFGLLLSVNLQSVILSSPFPSWTHIDIGFERNISLHQTETNNKQIINNKHWKGVKTGVYVWI